MVPDTFIPVPVTTTTLALPADEILTFPFAAGILTLLVPLDIESALPPDCATQLRLLAPSVDKTYPDVPPDILRLATAPNVTLAVVVKLTTPVALATVSPVSAPTEVMFGCAAVVSVPATSEPPIVPELA